MNWFRYSYFSLFIRSICIVLMLANPSFVIALTSVCYDETDRLAIIYSPLNPQDHELTQLIEKIQEYDRDNPDPRAWKVINKSELNINFEDFSTLSRYANFDNTGDLWCYVGSPITPNISKHIYNRGLITFLEGPGFNTPSLNLSFDSLENEGEINFGQGIGSHGLEWNLNVSNLQNHGALLSDGLLAINNAKGNHAPLRGYIASNGLALKGFQDIQAILMSGYSTPFSDRETRGFLTIDQIPVSVPLSGSSSSSSSSSMPVVQSTNFSWKGMAYAAGDTTLNLNGITRAQVGAYFDSRKFDAIIANQRSVEVSFYQDASFANSLFLNPFINIQNYLRERDIEDLIGASFFGDGGFNVSFSETAPRGILNLAGIYDVQGPLSFVHADTVSLGEKSHLSFHRAPNLDVASLNINGTLEKNEESLINEENRFSTTGNITVGKEGHLKLGRMTVEKVGQKLTNYGTTEIDSLLQWEKLEVHNKGELSISGGGGKKYSSLFAYNNQGHIFSALDVDSTYTNEFLASALDAALPIQVKGSIQSERGIKIRFPEDQRRKVTWEQSLQAGSIHVDAQSTDFLANKEHWCASKGTIKLEGKRIKVEDNVGFHSSAGIGIFTSGQGKVRFKGSLNTPKLFIRATELSGRGNFNVQNATIEANTASPLRFSWGEGLDDLLIRSKGSIELQTPDKALFSLGGHLDVLANQISVKSPIKAQGRIKMVADQPSRGGSCIEVTSDLVSQQKDVYLEGGAVLFGQGNQSSGRIRGSNVSVHDKTSPVLKLPQGCRIKAQEHVSLKSPNKIEIHGNLSGKQLSAKADEVFINTIGRSIKSSDDLKKAGFNGFSEGISIQSKHFTSSVPIGTGSLAARSSTFLPYDIFTKSFDIESEFIGLGKTILSSSAPSDLKATDLTADGTTIINIQGSTLTLAGKSSDPKGKKEEKSLHRLVGVDASQAKIIQKGSNLVIEDKSRFDSLETNHTTTVPSGSEVRAKSITTGTDQERLDFPGTVVTEQPKLHWSAPAISIRDLRREGNKRFEELLIQGDAGDIQGSLNAEIAALSFDTALNLRNAEIMAEEFHIRTKDILAEQSSLESRLSLIVAEGGHADLKGLSVNSTEEFSLKAEEAEIDPRAISTNAAKIHLEKYEGGIKGAIKLAHDLVYAKHVHIDDHKEKLVIDQPTQWRPNLSLAVAEVDVLESLKSLGSIALESETGIKVFKSIVAENLYLLAKKDDILFSRALLKAAKDMEIIAEGGNVVARGTECSARNDLTISAHKNVSLESEAVRYGSGENYADQKVPTKLTAEKGNLKVSAEKDISLKAVEARSGQDTTLRAGGNIVDAPLFLERQSVSHHKDGFTRDKYIHANTSSYQAGGKFTSKAEGGSQELYGPHVQAKKIDISACNDVNMHEVHDTHEHESQTRKKGGIFSRSKTVQENSFSARSKGAHLTGVEPTEITAGHDINLTNVTSRVPRTILTAVEGAVRILLGTNYDSYSRTESSSNIFWQKQSWRTEEHRTYATPVFEGVLEIHSKETLLQSVRGKTLEFLERIEQHGGKITHEFLEEVHHVDSKTVQGPTQALAAVVALAITICTYGAGAKLGALAAKGLSDGITATVVSGMTQAAFTSLCTQAGLALLNNQGNIGRAVKDLASGDTLKSIAISAGAAGLTASLGSQLGIKTSATDLANITKGSMSEGVVAHLKANLLRGAVSGAMSITIGGENPEEVLKATLRDVGVSVIGTVGANKIGEAYNMGQGLDTISHKILHGILGGVTGGLVAENFAKGAAAGALGAMVSEIAADLLAPEKPSIVKKIEAAERAKESSLTQEEKVRLCLSQDPKAGLCQLSAYYENVDLVANIAKLSAATAALLTKQDVNVAIGRATNAVENNFVPMVIWGAMAAWKIYSVYESCNQIIKAVEKGDKEEIAKAALDLASTLCVGKIGTALDTLVFAEAIYESWKTDGAEGVVYNLMTSGAVKILGKAGEKAAKKFNKTGNAHGAKSDTEVKLLPAPAEVKLLPNLSTGISPVKNGSKIEPKKFDYLFGECKSGEHNAARSSQLGREMQHLGIHNTEDGKNVLIRHFNDIVKNESNIINNFSDKYGIYEVRESLLFGPSGKAVKLKTTFEIMDDGIRRFVTTIPFRG